MTTERRTQLFRALVATKFNRSQAAHLMGVSRETVRQRLNEIGGIAGLLAWAVTASLASQADADALAVLAAKATPGANREDDVLALNAANQSGINNIKALQTAGGAPMLSATMSSAAVAVPQTSTVRVEGANREFAKRVALEISIRAALSREDMSSAIGRMIDFFTRLGEPDLVARILLDEVGPDEIAQLLLGQKTGHGPDRSKGAPKTRGTKGGQE